MTDDMPARPTSILELPDELTKDVMLDLVIERVAIDNHLFVIADQLMQVLYASYPGLLDLRFEGNHLIVLKQKDSGALMRTLDAVQRSWDAAYVDGTGS
jgi:hypothetical protein